MKISDLKKQFGSGFQLDVKELYLAPNRIHGLIGPNGCGKTTAAKLIAGLQKPDSGSIDSQELTVRDITVVSRRPYFLHTSVYKNLVYPLKLRGIKPDPEEVEHYLSLIGFQNKKRQYAPSLSSGEQQKLALIRAMIFSPKLIIVDEALSNLDIESVSMFEQLILDRQKKKPATWLMISHQLSHIRRMCDHVFFMNQGRLITEGTTDEILIHPHHPDVIRYLQHEAILYPEHSEADQV